MNKLQLNRIALVCASSDKINESLKAIKICTTHADFKKILFFSDIETDYTIKINKIRSVLEYNEFVYYYLPDYIDTDFVLTIQWDGFIVNPDGWREEFLEYDYIGAPWPWNKMCGNSGFCLKSKKFLEAQKVLSKEYKLEIDDEHGNHGLNDDVALCLKLRDKFLDMGCKYAPINIGYQFSTEHGKYSDNNSFGFHDFRQQPQFRNLIYDNVL